jgi:putative acetyltransferase
MDTHPILRPAREADVDDVARLWHTGWGDGHIGHVPDALVAHRTLPQFVARTRTRIDSMWVAEAGGRVVGFVVVKGDEVEQLYVDRPARGTGVAAELLRKGAAEIRHAGHPRAWLAVVAGNQRARAFYARLGWRDAGPMTYLAETEAGPFEVPTHRYEIDLP